MANTWAAIGRAQPHKMAGEILQNKMAIEQNERQGLLAQSKLAMDTEAIEQMRRKNAIEAETQRDLKTLIPVESFAQHFAGGVDSSNYKMAMEHATQMGWINTDATAPSISKKDAQEVQAWMQLPNVQKSIIRNSITDIDTNIAAIKGQAGEGPDGKPKELNPKQQEQLQQLQQQRIQALSVDSMVTQYYKEQAAKEAAVEQERRDIATAEALAKSKSDLEIRKAEAIAAKEARKAPVIKVMEKKDEKGVFTWHEWDKDTRQWNDTGRLSKAEGTGTGKERERATLIAKMPQFQAEAKADPNKLYAQKAIRLDENASPTVDAYGAPVVLPTFESIAGKRGAPAALMSMSEQWDDAVELQTLLKDPKVADDLGREVDSGLLDRIKGMVGNKLDKWMAERHILADSKTAEAIRRMQRIASEERKLFMGVAVTELEIKSALAWMPDAADSYDAMVNKINLMATEGEQHFRRYMDVYKDKANMAPYYNAWGLERFKPRPDGTWSEKGFIGKDAKGNLAEFLGGNKWKKL